MSRIPAPSEVMAHTNNYFPRACIDDRSWHIRGGVLSCDPLREQRETVLTCPVLPGDWIAIGPAAVNRGVWQVGSGGALTGAADEDFGGRVWLLQPPGDFLRLCQDIAAWCAAQPDDPAQSERFGDYSVTRREAEAWQKHFEQDLNRWRRMFTVVRV